MNTVEKNTDQPPSLESEEEALLLGATKEKLNVLGIRGPLRDKIRRLVSKDTPMAYDVMKQLETARQRMRGRLEHRVDMRLHELALPQKQKERAISWRKG